MTLIYSICQAYVVKFAFVLSVVHGPEAPLVIGVDQEVRPRHPTVLVHGRVNIVAVALNVLS
jgi:hypothetical protein